MKASLPCSAPPEVRFLGFQSRLASDKFPQSGFSEVRALNLELCLLRHRKIGSTAVVPLFVGLQFEVALPCAGSASVPIAAPSALSMTALMMGPPPELKSLLDPSGLVVRQLTGKHRV